MVVYLGVVWKYKSVLVIVFDGHHDRSVEKASPGKEHGGEGAAGRDRGQATAAGRDRG
jgi:hypothetical protein